MWEPEVAARALRTRSRLAIGCGAGLAFFALFGAWAYRAMIGGDDNDNLFNDLPEAFESLIRAAGFVKPTSQSSRRPEPRACADPAYASPNFCADWLQVYCNQGSTVVQVGVRTVRT